MSGVPGTAGLNLGLDAKAPWEWSHELRLFKCHISRIKNVPSWFPVYRCISIILWLEWLECPEVETDHIIQQVDACSPLHVSTLLWFVLYFLVDFPMVFLCVCLTCTQHGSLLSASPGSILWQDEWDRGLLLNLIEAKAAPEECQSLKPLKNQAGPFSCNVYSPKTTAQLTTTSPFKQMQLSSKMVLSLVPLPLPRPYAP